MTEVVVARTHLPLLIVPFRVILRGGKLNFPTMRLAVLLGWPAAIVSGILWEMCYRAFYQRFHWSAPDLPGEVIFGVFMGWLPAIWVSGAALAAKEFLDRVWPLAR